MTKTTKPSRMVKAILETADDMRRIGLMDAETHAKITSRHLGDNKIGMTPPHPGAFIREEILDELGLSEAAAARALGVSSGDFADLINGKTVLSADMAARIEKAFGVKATTLLNMQAWHDA